MGLSASLSFFLPVKFLQDLGELVSPTSCVMLHCATRLSIQPILLARTSWLLTPEAYQAYTQTGVTRIFWQLMLQYLDVYQSRTFSQFIMYYYVSMVNDGFSTCMHAGGV